MVNISIELPLDTRFLNLIIYEGCLYLAYKYKSNSRINLSANNAINIAINTNIKGEKVFNGKQFNVGLSTAGEVDKKHKNLGQGDILKYNKLFINYYKINQRIPAKDATYDNVINILREIDNLLPSNNIRINYNAINLRNKTIIIGNNSIGITNMLKCERYDSLLLVPQVRTKISYETLIIATIGLYSAFVDNTPRGIYFLTFSPETISNIISNCDISLLEKFFIIKESIIEELRRTRILFYYKTGIDILLEILLNIKIQRELTVNNLDKISLILFRMQLEKYLVPKIYEKVPIEIYRNQMFVELLARYSKEPYRLLGRLYNLLDNDIFRKSLLNEDREEHQNAIRAVYHLYKFITCSDAMSLYNFVRELHNIHQKVKDENYKKIIRECLTGISYNL